MRKLVAARPEVAPFAEEIATALLKEVTCEQVAQNVENAVRNVDFEDLDGGPTAFGYTEPVEAAWEALDAAVQPFVEDLKRHIELALETEALEICKGVLLGLYRLRDESHDVLKHAPDFAERAAGDALATWCTRRMNGGKKLRRQRPDFPSAFVRRSIPAWRGLVDRVLRSSASSALGAAARYNSVMTTTAEDVLRVALQLSEGERVRVAAELLATLEPDVENREGEAWIAEVERRAQAAIDGLPGLSWDDTRARVEGRVSRTRK